jgi:hypothetical protein
LAAKSFYHLMKDLDLFYQTVRLHAFSRTSNEGMLQSSEFWQPCSAFFEFALGKLKLVMIVARPVSGNHGSTWDA